MLLLTGIAALILFASAAPCRAQTTATDYVPDAVLVTVDAAHDTAAEVTRLSAVGNTDIRIPDIHVMRLRLAAAMTVPEAMATLEQYPEVTHAQPD